MTDRIPMGLPADNEEKAVYASRIFDGVDWHEDAAVLVEGARIRKICPIEAVPSGCDVQRLPEGASLVPGFIDVQVNGGGGILLNDDPSAEAMRRIALVHRRSGTTALLPTLITDTRAKTRAAIAAAREVAGTDGIIGLHLEGPFINPARAGIHPPQRIARASLDDLEWLRTLGQVGRSLVTLAPECVPEGFIRGLADAGIRVMAGHSEASAEIVLRAVEEGLSGITHLFNAMPPLKGREPGLLGAGFAERGLTAGLIVDGLHVDPVSVRAAFAAKGSEGIMFISDAMPTVGSRITEFQLAGRRISLSGGRLADDTGTLAGAHLDMCTAVRNATNLCGIALQDAICAATLTPARFLGIEKQQGTIRPGARADLVGLTKDVELVYSWVGGERAT